MAGQASISTDILARYAADAAREVEGVRGLAESSIPGRRGVRVATGEGSVHVELHLAVDWGASLPRLGRERAGAGARRTCAAWPTSRSRSWTSSSTKSGRGRDADRRADGPTLETAPAVCHECIWWQTRNGRSTDKRKWVREAEGEWGAWGTVYYDDDGGCSARCSTGRRRSSRAPPSFPPVRPATTPCSSPAPTSPIRRGHG